MPFSQKLLEQISENDPSISKLSHYRYPPITNADLSKLLIAAKDNTALKTIEIFDIEDIADPEAAIIAKLPSIETLKLSGCQVGDGGAAAIAKMQNLAVLFLEGNVLGNTGAKALAENKTITSLFMMNNPNIDETGWGYFVNNETLIEFQFDSDEMSSELKQQLETMLSKNKEKKIVPIKLCEQAFAAAAQKPCYEETKKDTFLSKSSHFKNDTSCKRPLLDGRNASAKIRRVEP